MKKIGLILAFCASTPVIAQQTPSPVANQGGVTGLTVPAYGSMGTTPQPVDATHGLPMNCVNGCSGNTRTTAAGTSDTQAVPVQGVTGGVPQNVAQSGAPWSDNLTQVGGSTFTLGQKTQANSIPVALASDGTYATAANQTNGTQRTGITTRVSSSLPSAYADASQQQPTIGIYGQTMIGGYSVAIATSRILSGTSSVSTLITNGSQATQLAVMGGYTDGYTPFLAAGDATGAAVFTAATASTLSGTTTATVTAATTNALKTSAGNAFAINVVNSTVAGFIVLYDATAAPNSGTALTASLIRYCLPIAAGQGLRDSFSMPIQFANGIQQLASTSCTTYTPLGTAPTLMSGQVK